MPALVRTAATLAGTAAAGLAYASLVEVNLYTLRRFDIPVLEAGSPPVHVLHVSDLHLMPNQHRKQRWIRALAALRPDLVINTGDTLSHPDGIDAVMWALEPLFAFPGAFVPGNNDYFAPRPKSPFAYFRPSPLIPDTRALPWPKMAAAMAGAGWLDLTHVKSRVTAGGVPLALAGTDDPHLRYARYARIAGAADASAAVRIGVTHSPEPTLLRSFSADGYDLVLAGHTHGGQVRVPFGPAIVTNCGIDVHRARWLHRFDERMWMHVCAGLGTNPYLPVRFACRPEASLLRLVPRVRDDADR